jgi:hypothetical protein
MVQFQYTAVNSAGKKLSGIIGAESENEARKQLNTLGISILDIKKELASQAKKPKAGGKETNLDNTSQELTKFEFEAFDKTGQKIVGTIPASSRYKAFKRLMEEYKFEVSYVVSFGATDEEKIKAKAEGLDVLKAEYQATAATNATSASATSTTSGSHMPSQIEEKTDPEFEKQKKALMNRVDFILDKIKKILTQYDKDIKPENKKVIQGYVDKLLRIKSSTNLEYIEHTSEEMLKKIQNQELFLHEDGMQDVRAKIQLQTQQMMASLHATPGSGKDILDDVEHIQKSLGQSESRLLKGLSQALIKYLPTPEEKELKGRLRALTKQILIYTKIWITAPKTSKEDAKNSITALLKERQNLKAELADLKKARLQTAQEQEIHTQPLITEEITSFLGWLLALYLATYFISHYVLAKNFPGGNPLPGDINLLNSGILQSLLISVFLWYALLSSRLEYLRYKSWANLLIIPLGILLNAIVILNL